MDQSLLQHTLFQQTQDTSPTKGSGSMERQTTHPVFSHLVKTEDELSESFELIKILRLYQQSNRWTLLIAPQNIPDKALLNCCSVDMDRVLVVHEKQISSVLATIENALSHATCSAVVAWSNSINNTKLAQINQLAEKSQCHFYAFNKHNKQSLKTNQTH